MKKQRKKNVRYRGSRTHGGGSKKKRRGKGSRGGRGFAGLHKHKFSYITTVDPFHYGYKGFVSRASKKPSINIDEALRLCSNGKVDLTVLGYGKLLSRGDVKSPVTITVERCSAAAFEKIESAGGHVLGLISAENEKPEKKVKKKNNEEDIEEE